MIIPYLEKERKYIPGSAGSLFKRRTYSWLLVSTHKVVNKPRIGHVNISSLSKGKKTTMEVSYEE